MIAKSEINFRLSGVVKMIPAWSFVGCFVAGVLLDIICNRLNIRENCLPWNGPYYMAMRRRGHEAAVLYLLARIGFDGGIEISSHSSMELIMPSAIAFGMTIGLCLLILLILTWTSSFDRDTRVSLAVHFGSVSLGTYMVILKLVQEQHLEFPSFVNVWVPLMELPALFIGFILLRGSGKAFFASLRNEPSLTLLPISILAGMIFGKSVGQTDIYSFVRGIGFELVLLFFLFEMGQRTGTSLKQFHGHSIELLKIGIGLPLMSGTLGGVVITLFGFGPGAGAIFAGLCASASYVAAPTAMRSALMASSGKNAENVQTIVSTSLTAALGITLPFNLMIGLRLYLWQNMYLFILPGVPVTILIVLLVIILIIFYRYQSKNSQFVEKSVFSNNRSVNNQRHDCTGEWFRRLTSLRKHLLRCIARMGI